MNRNRMKIFSLSALLMFLVTVTTTVAQDTTKPKSGEQVYKQNCLACHQVNGSGVPNLAPTLKKTSYVNGDKTKLINIVLKGFNEDVEIEGETFANPMPAFKQLSDDEIAKVLTYIRSNFGNDSKPVLADEVKSERAKMKKKE